MENWCEKHQAQWFKKGRMKGYAHPIEGSPGVWCNMPEGESASHADTYESVEPPLVKEAKKMGAVDDNQMTKGDWADKETRTRASIERQTALNDATDIAVAKISKGIEMTAETTIEVAIKFAKYLDTGE